MRSVRKRASEFARLSYAQRAAARRGPEHAIFGRAGNCVNVHSVFERLNEDFDVPITIEIGNGGCGG